MLFLNAWPTDRRTDRRTDTPEYRDARMHLEMICFLQNSDFWHLKGTQLFWFWKWFSIIFIYSLDSESDFDCLFFTSKGKKYIKLVGDHIGWTIENVVFPMESMGKTIFFVVYPVPQWKSRVIKSQRRKGFWCTEESHYSAF